MMNAAKQRVRAVVRRLAGLERLELERLEAEAALAELATRTERLEALLGLKNAQAPVSEAPAALETLLEQRLAQLEARILAYVEGPFAARLGTMLAETDAPADTSSPRQSKNTADGHVTR